MAPDTSNERTRWVGGDGKASPDSVRRRSLLEGAFGGWLSGLLFAAVDLSLVRVHPVGRRLASMIAVALGIYPLVALLGGLLVGLLAARRTKRGRPIAAESVFLLLSGIAMASLGAANLVYRVRDPSGFSWQALATAVVLAVAASACFVAFRRYHRGIPPAARLILGGVWLVTLAGTFGYSQGSPARIPRDGRLENLVILITADTLRADALGVYGNASARTLNLDALASDGALFLRAQSASSWTLPSHASILTGLTVPQHGANAMSFALNETASTVAERFRAKGFRTEAITSAVLTSANLFERGFDSFDDFVASPFRWLSAAALARKLSRFLPALNVPIEQRAGDVVDKALPRLREGGSLFLWLHFFDPHADYDPPPGFRDSLPARIPPPFDGTSAPLVAINRGQLRLPSPAEVLVLRKLYDGEVSFLDDQIGRLRREIEKAGLASRTSIVFTSDHGEAFGEHGRFLHTALFEEVVHVPLIVWAPGRVRPGSRVETVVRGIDVAPTLAELGGLRWTGPGDAASVLSLLGQEKSLFRPARSDCDIQVMYGEPGERTASLLVWPWKLIYRPSDRRINLFNLDEDPGETRDVALSEKRMADQLVEMLSAGETPYSLDRGRAPDAETIRQLRALGYMR